MLRCGSALSPLKELTDRNETVQNKMAIAGQESGWQQTENAKSTGQQRGLQKHRTQKVGVTVLIFYNNNYSNKNFHVS